MEASVIGVLFLITGVGILGFLYKPIFGPKRPGDFPFGVIVIGGALWPLSLGLVSVVDGPRLTLAAWGLRMMAPTILSVGWVLLVIQFVRTRPPSRLFVGMLAAYVGFELLLVTTNPIHGYAFDPSTADSFGLVSTGSPWFWTKATVNYLLVTSATVLLAAEVIRSSGLRRRQAILLVAAAVPAVGADVISTFELVAAPFDLTPLGILGSGALITWAIYRARLLDIVPVGRSIVVEEIDAAVITLDSDGRVIDCNTVAQQYFDVPDGSPGFGVGGALTAVGGAGYLLRSRFTDRDTAQR